MRKTQTGSKIYLSLQILSIAGRFSTSWVTREAQSHHISAELTNLGPEEAG